MKSIIDAFRINGRVAVITGGGGLMGIQHGLAIAEAGGTPVLWDIDKEASYAGIEKIQEQTGKMCYSLTVDISKPKEISRAYQSTLEEHDKIDILINNATIDPKVNNDTQKQLCRFENFPWDNWIAELNVGLGGAFLCSQVIGNHMAESGGGVILNIASDLGVIAPDQRIYRKEKLPYDQQPVKPVTYSVIKHGLIGLTKYLATYWADRHIRVNAISPGGVYTNQPDDFVEKLRYHIPMKRMAKKEEYKAAVLFLISDASSYMTGQNLIIDGGRTCW